MPGAVAGWDPTRVAISRYRTQKTYVEAIAKPIVTTFFSIQTLFFVVFYNSKGFYVIFAVFMQFRC